jgi:hypothetical protein
MRDLPAYSPPIETKPAPRKNTMNTTADTTFAHTPRPLLSLRAHLVAIVAVGTLVSLAWVGAERSSHEAVQSAVQTFAPVAQSTRVTLPPVEIVWHREQSTTKPARRIAA